MKEPCKEWSLTILLPCQHKQACTELIPIKLPPPWSWSNRHRQGGVMLYSGATHASVIEVRTKWRRTCRATWRSTCRATCWWGRRRDRGCRTIVTCKTTVRWPAPVAKTMAQDATLFPKTTLQVMPKAFTSVKPLVQFLNVQQMLHNLWIRSWHVWRMPNVEAWKLTLSQNGYGHIHPHTHSHMCTYISLNIHLS